MRYSDGTNATLIAVSGKSSSLDLSERLLTSALHQSAFTQVKQPFSTLFIKLRCEGMMLAHNDSF
jgi:hypothetical protein